MPQNVINTLKNNHIIQAIVFVTVLLILFQIRGLILSLFVAFIIASTFNPLVTYLEKKRIPRSLALVVPYILSGLIFALIILPLFPFFALQFQSLFDNFPSYIERAGTFFGVPLQFTDLQGIINAEADIISRNILSTSTKIFGGFFTVLSTLVISFYLLADFKSLDEKLSRLFPKAYRELAQKTFDEVKVRLGQWFGGQVVLSLVVGSLTYILLTIFQVPYAFVLALIAGLLEIIPTIGPVVSAVPAVIIALARSPTQALIVVCIYIVVQLLENNILVPRIMQKAVGLHPLMVLLGVIIGGQLLGLPGALLSIPFLAVANTIWSNFKERKIES